MSHYFLEKKRRRKKFHTTSARLYIQSPPRTEAEAPIRNDGVIYRTLLSTLQLIQSDFFFFFFQMNALLIGRSAACCAGQRAAVEALAWWKRPRLNLFSAIIAGSTVNERILQTNQRSFPRDKRIIVSPLSKVIKAKVSRCAFKNRMQMERESKPPAV